MTRRGSGPTARGRRSSCSSGDVAGPATGGRSRWPESTSAHRRRRRGSPHGRPDGREHRAVSPCTRARRSARLDALGSAVGATNVNLNIPNIDPTVIALLVPIIVLEVGLLIAAVIDLLRDDRAVRGGNKGLWAVIIVFVNLIGPVLYFLVGRVDGVPEDTTPAPGAVPGWGSPHDPPVAGR